MVNFKIYDVRHWIITKHILTNILRTKGNQAMKNGQLIKYSAKNIFVQKS